MGVFSTPAGLAIHQKKRGILTVANINQAHTVLATQGKRDFQALTSGGLKAKTLRAMGHPYAKTGGAVPGAARGITSDGNWKKAGYKKQVSKSGMVRRLPINIQTGRLRGQIQLDGPRGSQKTYQLYSRAKYAKFVLSLDGTDRMVARGLKGPQGELRRRHKARKHTMKDILVRSHRMA